MARFLTFLLASLPFVAPLVDARASHGSTRRQHRNIHPHVARASNYTLVDKYQGESFFDGWDFFTGEDPTHGNVQFVDQATAQSAGLVYVESDGTASIDVDANSTVAVGGNRRSVRISTTKTYNGGLFIADFYAMPHGCGVWPAYWSLGTDGDWPTSGEIDIVEGVNQNPTNQMTLHSTSGCELDTTPSAFYTTSSNITSAASNFFGQVLGTQCASSDTSNAGCAVLDTDLRSFGHGFNDVAGGVFAHLWDSNGIAMWHFARDEVPSDITSGNPDPSSWPSPTALFSNGGCDIGSHFYSHQLILDTTICGDWAGAAYQAVDGCPATCAEAVADPSNFAVAKWKINYIAVYQQ